MMTLRTAPGIALRTAAISARTPAKSPASAAPTSMTMSISAAPAATASAASAALISEECLPDGNPATAATSGPAGRCATAASTIDGDTHTA